MIVFYFKSGTHWSNPLLNYHNTENLAPDCVLPALLLAYKLASNPVESSIAIFLECWLIKVANRPLVARILHNSKFK